MADMQEKEYYLDLGRKFKTLRKRVGKTTEEVAEEIGVDRAMIAQFENYGKKISAYRINQLFKVFGFEPIETNLDEVLSGQKKNPISIPLIKSQLLRLLEAAEEAVKNINEENRIDIPEFLRTPATGQYDNQHSQERLRRVGVRLNPLFFASPVLRRIVSPRALLAAHTRDADCPPSQTISPSSATCSRSATPSQARREDATRILKFLERFPAHANFQTCILLLCIA